MPKQGAPSKESHTRTHTHTNVCGLHCAELPNEAGERWRSQFRKGTAGVSKDLGPCENLPGLKSSPAGAAFNRGWATCVCGCGTSISCWRPVKAFDTDIHPHISTLSSRCRLAAWILLASRTDSCIAAGASPQDCQQTYAKTEPAAHPCFGHVCVCVSCVPMVV